MKIKVEPFLMKRGSRVAKAAIEFEKNDGILAGFHLLGFTICEDSVKGMFIMFPSAVNQREDGTKRPFFFLKPGGENMLSELSDKILSVYYDMIKSSLKS